MFKYLKLHLIYHHTLFTQFGGGLVANLNLLAKYAQNKMLNLIETYFHTQVHLLQNLCIFFSKMYEFDITMNILKDYYIDQYVGC